jgi:DNA-binding Xre family transcriptional regulator
MNLTEEKKTPLREQTVVNKKKMLMMHYKKSSNVRFCIFLLCNYLYCHILIIISIYRKEIKIKFVINLQNIFSTYHSKI